MRIRLLSLFAACFFFIVGASAQDAAARKDLQRLRAAYESAQTLEADLALEMQFPGQPAEVQQGHLQQKADMFNLYFDQQVIISDGKSVWMYLPDNKEAQVYDASSAGDLSGGFMRPQDILEIYDNEGFEYAITGEVREGGHRYKQIEFKPTETGGELAKIRLTYNADKGEVVRIRVFNKDGSRFALRLSNVQMGGVIPDERFVFRAADYPGVRIEDMRL